MIRSFKGLSVLNYTNDAKPVFFTLLAYADQKIELGS